MDSEATSIEVRRFLLARGVESRALKTSKVLETYFESALESV